MIVGGNDKAYEFFKNHGWTDEGADRRTAKYTSKAAVLYKEHIRKQIVQQRAAIMATLVLGSPDAPAAKKAALPSDGMDGLDALMADVAGAKPTGAQSGGSLLKKPVSSASEKSLSPSLAAQLPDDKPKPRVIIRKKPATTDEGAKSAAPKISLSRKGPSLPSSSSAKSVSLAASLSTKRKPTKVSVGASNGASVGDDDDFDAQFAKMTMETQKKREEEAAARAQAEEDALAKKRAPVQQKVNSSSSFGSSSRQESDERLGKYANATSIGSDQFFQRGNYAETSEEDKERLGKFHSANAIGSDAFFGREQQEMGTSGRGGSGSVDMQDVRQAVGQAGRQIGSMASGLFGALKSRYQG
eukprot:CAMPEP_0175096594 /NCGR_PEP_ID=MMETSP0086_2-20121207/4816_1 /TAXON_ID=136419 /ORGANISM="Unknown Unknown, Strain D1" /LENGTH=356 /DNA_ID=CAMNT_0016370007 /DNA_START=279 /DNA_END=1349 /DNA_ORIENTATION=-